MKKYFFLVLFNLLTLSVFGKIVEANSIEEVKKWVGSPNEKTLVLFDIDHTLIRPTCPAFQYKNKVRYKSILNQIDWTEEEKIVATNLSDLAYRAQLLEPQSVAFIDSLQQQKIPIMAFTSAMTGRLGKIQDILSWREKQLQQFGIDFSKTSPYLPRFQLDKIHSFLGTYPEGACGIICANHQPKGEVLEYFLKLIDWRPEKVFLIDDTLEKLESMEEPMQNLGIDFIGIHYLAKTFLEDRPIDADAFLCFWLKLKREAIEIIKKRRRQTVPS